MAKEDIQKLIEDAIVALEAEYDNQTNTIKSEIKSFKAKTVDKISKNTP
jgi:hypothetical protein